MTDMTQPSLRHGPAERLFGWTRGRVARLRRDPATLAAAMMLLAFVLFVSTQVVGDYQSDNGDYYQYQMHADNLRAGAPWDRFVDGYPSVLPGWPVMLLLWQTLFGGSFTPIGVLNALLWAGCAWIYNGLFARLGWRPGVRVAFVALMCVCPSVIANVQEGQPNLFAAFATALALSAAYRMAGPGPELDLAGEGTTRPGWAAARAPAFLLLSLVRVESAVVYLASAIHFAVRGRWRPFAWCVLGMALTLGVSAWLAVAFDMKSNLSHGTSIIGKNGMSELGSSWAALQWLEHRVAYFGALLARTLEAFAPQGFSLGETVTVSVPPRFDETFSLFTLAALGLMAVGLFARECRVDAQGGPGVGGVRALAATWLTPMKLTLAGHLAFWTLVGLDFVHDRYLFPVLPIALAFAVRGAALVLGGLGRAAAPAGVLLTLALTGMVATHMEFERTQAKRRNAINHPAAVAAYDAFAARVSPGQRIGAYKPRVLTGELYKRGALSVRANTFRYPFQVEKHSEDGALIFVDWRAKPGVREGLREDGRLCVLWAERGYEIWGPPSAAHPCLPPESEEPQD